MPDKKILYGECYNDSPYPISKSEKRNGKWVTIWSCPIYTMWKNILKRCYDSKFLQKYPTYIGTTISDEWKLFSNFHSWVITQPYKDRDIDKDLLFQGNKLYSKETCIFVPHEINTLILTGGKRRTYMMGVEYDNNLSKPYRAHGTENNKKKHLGCYLTEMEAHQAWQKHKILKTEVLMKKYMSENDLLNVLTKYKRRIETDLNNNEITK